MMLQVHRLLSPALRVWAPPGGFGGLRAVLAACVLVATSSSAVAAERYAIVVTGASGGPQYAQKYAAWRASFLKTLRDRFAYPDDHITVLAEEETAGVVRATRENVRLALGALRTKALADDTVVILLIGHGATADGDAAKFNLVGPDLSAAEWADLIRPIRAHVVFANTSSGSFAYLEALAGSNRVVLTANDSAAQQFETVLPEYFVKAFEDDEADLDKNGKVSFWEAFVYASAGVKRWFEERGQLATERPLLDDTGDGVGREADGDGPDGIVAQTTYLQQDRIIPDTGDSELTALLRRRAAIETELEELRARKPRMSADDYDNALEKLMIQLAQIDRRVRAKS